MPGLINEDGNTGLAYRPATGLQWQTPVGGPGLTIVLPPPPEE